MTRDPHPWAAVLGSLHAQVWTCLVRGVHDRRAPARHPAFATVTPDGLPRVCTVALRGADSPAAQLEIHTDLHSAKVSELRARPCAALHVWDSPGHLQVRIDTEAEILTGIDVADFWARVPEPSRLNYGIAPPPGVPIAGALNYSRQPGPESFAVLRLRVMAIDVLHLGPDHRRACFRRTDGWTGQWLAPLCRLPAADGFSLLTAGGGKHFGRDAFGVAIAAEGAHGASRTLARTPPRNNIRKNK